MGQGQRGELWPAQGDIVRVPTIDGPMWVFRHDLYVSRSLIEYGEYAQGEADLFRQILKPGMAVVEAGANLGSHSVLLARGCAPGPFFAFEPQPRVFQVLCTNLTINGIANARAYPEALGAAAGTADIDVSNYGQPGNFGSASVRAQPRGLSERVRVSPLDDWQLPALHFLKVDVEGSELDVLRGAEATIRRCRPVIFTENDRAAHQPELVQLLSSWGYRLYWHVTPLFRLGNTNGRSDNIFGPTVALNMFCVPEESALSVTGLEQIDPKNWQSPVKAI